MREGGKTDNGTAVYGIYRSRTSVENAVAELRNNGFRHEDISVLFPNPDTSKEFAVENTTKAPEGTATGAATGAAIGGTLGWLAGIGAIAIPGVGPFVAAGPIMGLLAGIGTGGAVGSLAGALIGLGIPEYEAARYEAMINDGGILVSVHADDDNWTDKAEAILERTGATDISSRGEAEADTEAAVGNR